MSLPSAGQLPDDLSAALARARTALPGRSIELYHLIDTGSTNDVAAELATSGAADGTAVVADRQTAGRGRRGRSWHSPGGSGLYFSLLLRPAASSPADGRSPGTSLLTLMAGVATADAVERASGVRAALKWPNDLVVEHRTDGSVRRLKLAGILAEGSAVGASLQHVVLGIGINLRTDAYPPELAGLATSIEREVGHPPDRALLVTELLVGLLRGRAGLEDGGGAELLDRWRALATASLGREVEWSDDRERRRGTTRDVDEDGALVVATDRGDERVLGEVTWL